MADHWYVVRDKPVILYGGAAAIVTAIVAPNFLTVRPDTPADGFTLPEAGALTARAIAVARPNRAPIAGVGERALIPPFVGWGYGDTVPTF